MEPKDRPIFVFALSFTGIYGVLPVLVVNTYTLKVLKSGTKETKRSGRIMEGLGWIWCEGVKSI